MAGGGEARAKWLLRLLSTDPADRNAATSGVHTVYEAGRFAAPLHVCWFDSPIAAAWAVALVQESHHPVWRTQMGAARRAAEARGRIEEAERALCTATGAATPAGAVAAIGRPLSFLLQYMPVAAPMLFQSLVGARLALAGGDAARMFAGVRDEDPISRAEQRLWAGSRAALASPICAPITGPLIAQSFFAEYTFATMAHDEELATAAGREPAPGLAAAWRVASVSGPWWPFAGAAILSDRPAELHVDDQGLLHRVDGPAIVYRDGARVYAWHGLTVPEDWILRPEAIPPAKLKGFDAGFRKHAESRRKAAGAPPKPPKPGPVFAAALPEAHEDRLRVLREYAGGSLPLLDRYVAGEHTAVWTELMALGSNVRHGAPAADALAVAYETMRRVGANVRTLVQRLQDLGYEFTTADGRTRDARAAHVPPGRRFAKDRARLEKRAGTLPLSLRAFLEVVGSVDLIGRHPRIAPDEGPTAPDPLVVAGVDEMIDSLEGWDDDEPLLILAPDDLHKANTSGGDPYAMAVPDGSADALLLNERHGLLFVDYLRLAFRFGGFPGYEGTDDPPVELASLSRDLLPF